MMIDLKKKKVSIIGAGRSGIAVAEVIKPLGAIPFLSDSAEPKDTDRLKRIKQLKIKSEFNGHSDKVYECDLMVISPGVPSNAEVIRRAKSLRIPVWPEIELAYRLCRGRIIAVTGSNGKTTTTSLIGEICEHAGVPSFVCGNIGNPFIGVARQVPPEGFAIIELSSFQLELIDVFRPDIAVFLNLTPDHLDRHKDLDEYISAKMRVFENQKAQDVAVVNHDDSSLRDRCASLAARTVWFSVKEPLKTGAWANPDGGIFSGKDRVMRSAELKIKGEHNLSNACAAVAAASSAGIQPDVIADSLKNFTGVEHRLEPVRLIGGVSFINDSKGTNVDSVFWALKAVSAPVILIAGGKDKGSDFTTLNDLITQKVKLVILIGQAAQKIEKAWGKITHCASAPSMEDAVRMAHESATDGDTVLLSPGCASFDMFDNYEHRGRVFKQAVNNLEVKVGLK